MPSTLSMYSAWRITSSGHVPPALFLFMTQDSRLISPYRSESNTSEYSRYASSGSVSSTFALRNAFCDELTDDLVSRAERNSALQ